MKTQHMVALSEYKNPYDTRTTGRFEIEVAGDFCGAVVVDGVVYAVFEAQPEDEQKPRTFEVRAETSYHFTAYESRQIPDDFSLVYCEAVRAPEDYADTLISVYAVQL